MENKKLIAFLNESNISIPSYQRVYTWGKKEIATFIEDLKVDIFKERLTNIGVVYYESSSSSDNEYHIIDGQQRITTSSLIMIALSSLIKSQDLKKFVIDFHEKKVFKSTIKQLSDIYQGFYTFLELLIENEFDIEKTISDFDTYATEKIINTSANNDLIFSLKVAHDILSENKKTELASLFNQIKTIEFEMLANPYDNDPITIFERLNNRGKELSFISLSKVSIYQFFDEKLKSEGVKEHEEISTEFMEIYTETINSVFFSSHTNFKMENRDKFLESTMRSYLSVKANKKVPSNRNDLLEELELFIDKEVSMKYASKKERLNTILSLMKEYLFFASISLVYKSCQTAKESTKKKLSTAYYLNDKKIDKRFDLLSVAPDSDFPKNLATAINLKEVNLEKFKDLIIYILTQSLIRKDLFNEKKGERKKTVSEITEGLVRWTNINWVNFTKEDIEETTFREVMKLDKFIEEFFTTSDSREKMDIFNSYVSKQIKKEYKVKNVNLVEKAVNNSSLTDRKVDLIIKRILLAKGSN